MLGRLLLATIFFVCLAAIMVSLLQGPISETSTETETEAGETPSATPARRTAPSGTTAVAAVSPAPAPASTRSTTASLTEGIPPLPDGSSASQQETEPARAPGTYVRSPAALYSANFGTGAVLTRLDEGVRVSRGVSVLNQEGWWVEVRVDETAGFVRSEDLVDNN